MNKVTEKLNKFKRPVFFPVYGSSCPVWKTKHVLVSFEAVPKTFGKEWREKMGWSLDDSILITESGGVATIKAESQEECLKSQLRCFPDLCFILDYPVKTIRGDSGRGNVPKCRKCGTEILVKNLKSCPKCGSIVITSKTSFSDVPEVQKMKKLKKTVENAKLAMVLKDTYSSLYEHDFEPMAVIQGWDLKSLTYCTTEMVGAGYQFFACGTVTTSDAERLKLINQTREYLSTIKDIIGKRAWLHLLGVTSIKILLLLRGLFDSFDSAYPSIQAKNAQFVGVDKNYYVGRNETERQIKFLGFKLDDTESYLALAKINYENYLKRLKMVNLVEDTVSDFEFEK